MKQRNRSRLRWSCGIAVVTESKRLRVNHILVNCGVFPRYESCWPAFWHGSNGVILVYRKRSEEQAVEQWWAINRIIHNHNTFLTGTTYL